MANAYDIAGPGELYAECGNSLCREGALFANAAEGAKRLDDMRCRKCGHTGYSPASAVPSGDAFMSAYVAWQRAIREEHDAMDRHADHPGHFKLRKLHEIAAHKRTVMQARWEQIRDRVQQSVFGNVKET